MNALKELSPLAKPGTPSANLWAILLRNRLEARGSDNQVVSDLLLQCSRPLRRHARSFCQGHSGLTDAFDSFIFEK
ncbi:hypothetical protein [Shinella sumterensis]|uniref:Uncharacterized protein n=1 Tax=Shinella sumterensis TaxID=1967501 RepID=A0AA50CPY2_9HYPH|nr:hypothetical protein [Shinella sumterensis]WLS00681.1 hypothetical protein Q9313_25260 [Shinella sumterensis]